MPSNDRISCLEQLVVKYKGTTKENTSGERIVTIVYQGSRELCEQAMAEMKINSVDKEYGNLENARMYQDAGPFWNLELRYSVDTTGVGIHSSGSSYGPKQSELSMRVISMPLESKEDYLKNWNYNFYCTNKSPSQVPTAWVEANAKDDKIRGTQYEYTGDPAYLKTQDCWAWGKSYGELPTLPQGYIWHKIMDMTKPGVESFDYPSYEITEVAKHSTAKQAAWALKNMAGKISTPENGDFDIVKKFGGNWLCQGATIRYDGKYWLTNCQYLYSPDGWDRRFV